MSDDEKVQIKFVTSTEKSHMVDKAVAFTIEKVDEWEGNYGPQWVLLINIPSVGARKLSFKKGNKERDNVMKNAMQYGGYWTLNFDPFKGKTGYYYIEEAGS